MFSCLGKAFQNVINCVFYVNIIMLYRKRSARFYLKVTDFHKDQITHYGVYHETIDAERFPKSLHCKHLCNKIVANLSKIGLSSSFIGYKWWSWLEFTWILDHPNYLKWGCVFLNDTKNLPTAVFEAFFWGCFTIKKKKSCTFCYWNRPGWWREY